MERDALAEQSMAGIHAGGVGSCREVLPWEPPPSSRRITRILLPLWSHSYPHREVEVTAALPSWRTPVAVAFLGTGLDQPEVTLHLINDDVHWSEDARPMISE